MTRTGYYGCSTGKHTAHRSARAASACFEEADDLRRATELLSIGPDARTGLVVQWDGGVRFRVYLSEDMGGYQVEDFTCYGDDEFRPPTPLQAAVFARKWLDAQKAL